MKPRTKILLLIVLFLNYCEVGAQDLASARVGTRNIDHILGIKPEDAGKCGTSSLVLAYTRWPQLDARTRLAVLQAVQRPANQKSRLSPSGRFRIHYDTTGINAPALVTPGSAGIRIAGTAEKFIDSVAYYFDAAWRLEVDSMRYSGPPSDGSQGGGQEYDVYVSELGTDMFGQTSWNPVGDLLENGNRQRFSTYTEIDNDFANYRTPGIDGLRVTAVHEFFHAIQVGSYGVWQTVPNSDFYFYEISSVWMEYIAHSTVHDYYYYLPKFFQYYRDGQNRSYSFTKFDGAYRGYERVVWAMFLAEKFGMDVIRQIWAGMRLTPSLASTSGVLSQYGTTIENEYSQFSVWNFFTADRADPVKSYDEGRNFPRYRPNVSSGYFGSEAVISGSAPAMSTQMYEFALTQDTITVVVTNRDASSALVADPPKSDLTLRMKSSGLEPPYHMVADGVGISFRSNELTKWSEAYLRSSTRGSAITLPGPSPNPLRLATDSRMMLPVGAVPATDAELRILNSAAELVFTGHYQVRESLGVKALEVPTSDIRSALSGGVYFVVAKCGDEEYKWKVAVIK